MGGGERRCWVCGSTRLRLAKPADDFGKLTPDAFAITDYHYGRTAAIHRCQECSFLECPDLVSVLPYYEALEDREYEEGRAQRALQSRRLVEQLADFAGRGRLLDVGAGSGILVEEARALGFEAEGIEPSAWLQERARARGLPVHRGTLPHPEIHGPYEAVTLIDVLEHVSDPVGLLRDAGALLAPGGTLAVVTPDVASRAARLLGWRWWHYRVAHIGYFKRSTLSRALARSGLELVEIRRPGWYFGADYLMERVNSYLPRWLRLPVPGFLGKITVPLNLRDSILAFCRARADGA